jgi:septum formation protein
MTPDAPAELLLASTSRYRVALLERLGVPFRAVAPDCDEDAYKSRGLSPESLAELLAQAKAESLLATHPGATILGSDQVAALGDELLGKPGTPEAACAQLARLAGRTHRLVTAVAILHGGRVHRHSDITTLTMRALTSAQIERYVAADAPLDCAGSYKLEARGIALFSRIDSADHSAIVGLPLIAVAELLIGLGYAIP